MLIDRDLGHEKFCQKAVKQTASEFGKIDILASSGFNPFRTNIFVIFFLVKAAVKHFRKGSATINTASVTTDKKQPALSQAHVEKGIRVNAVASGPIWTPLIPSPFPAKDVATFGSDVLLDRSRDNRKKSRRALRFQRRTIHLT